MHLSGISDYIAPTLRRVAQGSVVKFSNVKAWEIGVCHLFDPVVDRYRGTGVSLKTDEGRALAGLC